MLDNQATENLEVVVVGAHSPYETTVRADGLSKIKHLKFLNLQNENFVGSLNHLSSEVGYLIWKRYPFERLPPSFQPDNLVELNLTWSSIQRLWEGTKPLHNLKRLDLSYSKNLVEMPDLGEALDLEGLHLQGCIQLRKIHSSIGLLRKLTVLDLTNCQNLVSLPNTILELNSLEYLGVSGCSKLYNNQLLHEARNTQHLKKLCLVEAPIHSQSTSSLYSRAQRESVSCLLPSSPTLPCLRELDLSFCNLVQIPDDIGNLRCLEKLNLKGNNFTTLPNLKDLFKLYYLNLQHCKQLKYLSHLPSRTDLPSNIYILPYSFSILDRDEYKAGLMIFNCPELVERERCTNMTLSWMVQVVQATQQYKSLTSTTFGPDVESIIPGSEIPRWFNNQFVSIDNSIIIDASPVMHDKYWVGVVCCAILRTSNIRKMNCPRTAHLGNKTVPVDLTRDLFLDHLDHMWLFYSSRQQFTPDACDFRLKFTISKEDKLYGDNIKKGLEFEVKKYGYRFVYEQDLNLLNLPIMHSENFTARKRKYSAIEEIR